MKSKATVAAFSFIAVFLFVRAAAQDDGKVLFPHKSHVELHSCPACHKDPGGSSEPVIPAPKICGECHDDSPEDLLDLKNRKKLFPVLSFSHDYHGDLKCVDCHEIAEGKAPVIPGYPSCKACHAEKDVDAGCADCHTLPVTPSTHRNLWEKTHGVRAEKEKGKGVHGRDCSMCHPEPVCESCHRTARPKSHTGFFVKRGHGLKASIESGSCMTCHKESFCVHCHRETKPLNHVGNWESIHGYAIPGGHGGPIGKCAVCHKDSWCAACHSRK
jgi:hypothetical protein